MCLLRHLLESDNDVVGRVVLQVFVGLPSEEQRRRVLEALLAGLPAAADVDVTWLARATPGYSGADLKLLLQEACYSASARATAAPEGVTTALEGVTAVPEGVTAPPEGVTAAPERALHVSYQ